MGNVLKALQKAGQTSEATAEPTIHVISMAVANAAKIAKESLDRDATTTKAPKAAAARPATAVQAPTVSTIQVDVPSPAAPAEATVVHYSPLLIMHHKPRCIAAEQVRQLRTSMLKIAGKNPVRCLVTSAQPQEGKSVTSSNLAYSFSELTHKRTLLIDADLRCGRVDELFGIKGHLGLADLLARRCIADDVICRSTKPNLDIVPAGEADLDLIGELLSGEWAEAAVRDLCRGYDHVIFDGPPTLGLADTGIMGHWATTALLAVRVNKTMREQVEQASQALQTAGVNVSGLVAIDEQATGRQYYRYTE
jgi:capsular exopolysaccharide synthesis family protein